MVLDVTEAQARDVENPVQCSTRYDVEQMLSSRALFAHGNENLLSPVWLRLAWFWFFGSRSGQL